MDMLIASIIGYAVVFFIGIMSGISIATKFESPEFKSAKINAFDMTYYGSMSRKYSAIMKEESDRGDNTEYLLAADKESSFRDKEAKSKAAYDAESAKLSERERSRLSKYINELEQSSDALIEIAGK
ncbi:MAG: hypothetical protein NTV45_04070 [Firmicutes bacterium]|nr:hypothetical protein [Bacillota bacterium]